MKKLFVFLAVALGAVSFVSCSNEETSSFQTPLKSNPYDYIGKLHNKALDYIFSSNMRGESTNLDDDYVEEQREMMATNCYNYLDQALKSDERFNIDDYYQADDDADITDAINDAFTAVETTSGI